MPHTQYILTEIHTCVYIPLVCAVDGVCADGTPFFLEGLSNPSEEQLNQNEQQIISHIFSFRKQGHLHFLSTVLAPKLLRCRRYSTGRILQRGKQHMILLNICTL
jgi:hypothetical protein